MIQIIKSIKTIALQTYVDNLIVRFLVSSDLEQMSPLEDHVAGISVINSPVGSCPRHDVTRSSTLCCCQLLFAGEQREQAE
jgi:hypothetical protein